MTPDQVAALLLLIADLRMQITAQAAEIDRLHALSSHQPLS